MGNKVGIISQARMTSTRLPGKVLKKVGDSPLLHYHVERLKKTGLELILATTTNDTDKPIVEFCRANSCLYFRGDENDVLSRFYLAAKENKLDTIIRVTSDCPLIDGELILKGLKLYQNRGGPNLYVSNCLKRTFARGFDFEIFSFELLERANFDSVKPEEREHVTPFIYGSLSKEQRIDLLGDKDNSHLRITVDEERDFELIKKLILDHDCQWKSAGEIEQILNSHPQLVAINNQVEQKKNV